MSRIPMHPSFSRYWCLVDPVRGYSNTYTTQPERIPSFWCASLRSTDRIAVTLFLSCCVHKSTHSPNPPNVQFVGGVLYQHPLHDHARQPRVSCPSTTRSILGQVQGARIISWLHTLFLCPSSRVLCLSEHSCSEHMRNAQCLVAGGRS